jgi:hypothetical protein
MQVKMFKLLTTTVLQTIKKTSFSIQKSAAVNAALTAGVKQQRFGKIKVLSRIISHPLFWIIPHGILSK